MAREVCEDKSRNMISSGSFCYTDVSSGNPTPFHHHHQAHLVNQIQGFETNPSEIFNLTTGMEMIGFSKNLQQQQQQQHSDNSSVMWKGFFNNKHGPSSSSSKTINESTTSQHDFYQQQHHDHHQFNKPDFTTGMSETSSENLLVGGHEQSPWQENRTTLLVDDSTLRCVFPCEGNERPSQGLSLSLSSNNPSSIGLQSFELRQTNHHNNNSHHDQTDDMRFMGSSSREGLFFGKSPTSSIQVQQQQQQMIQDGFLGKAESIEFQVRNSKYLGPAQDLLNEFCSLGTKQNDPLQKLKTAQQKTKQRDDENNIASGSSSSRKQSLHSLEFMELQKRKTKLLSMLDEVDRRYRHYCDQMKAVVSSFEEVAGHGAAKVYSALASKAMSRHFRCLRDGIVNQIQATRKAMGEKDPVAPGTTRGETPRLRILDQTLRQQRAFQQMSMMETHPWRPQRGLPERSVSVLRAWLFEHFLHPYPSDVDKHILARQTGLSRSQVSNWFINARVRLWKPMVEEMYLEETKEQDDDNNNNTMVSSDGVTDLDDNIIGRPNQINQTNMSTDQKPTQDQLIRIDSECLSSIINNPDKNNNNNNDPKTTKTLQNHHLHHHQQQHQQQSYGTFGAMELDFSSYNQHAVGGVSYGNENGGTNSTNQNFNGGGGVSLTLGLQQHGGSGGGVSLAFSSATQSSLFYSRDHIEDCQPVQYSLLDGDQGQNLPYRNLMGAQLLHDLAG